LAGIVVEEHGDMTPASIAQAPSSCLPLSYHHALLQQVILISASKVLPVDQISDGENIV